MLLDRTSRCHALQCAIAEASISFGSITGGQDQVALQVLTTAREQLNAERLRAINALAHWYAPTTSASTHAGP